MDDKNSFLLKGWKRLSVFKTLCFFMMVPFFEKTLSPELRFNNKYRHAMHSCKQNPEAIFNK
jgi:hypothetical protein